MHQILSCTYSCWRPRMWMRKYGHEWKSCWGQGRFVSWSRTNQLTEYWPQETDPLSSLLMCSRINSKANSYWVYQISFIFLRDGHQTTLHPFQTTKRPFTSRLSIKYSNALRLLWPKLLIWCILPHHPDTLFFVHSMIGIPWFSREEIQGPKCCIEIRECKKCWNTFLRPTKHIFIMHSGFVRSMAHNTFMCLVYSDCVQMRLRFTESVTHHLTAMCLCLLLLLPDELGLHRIDSPSYDTDEPLSTLTHHLDALDLHWIVDQSYHTDVSVNIFTHHPGPCRVSQCHANVSQQFPLQHRSRITTKWFTSPENRVLNHSK